MPASFGTNIQNATIALYSSMPDAPEPKVKDGYCDWSSVEDNQHWTFCEAIAAQFCDIEQRIRALDERIARLDRRTIGSMMIGSRL